MIGLMISVWLVAAIPIGQVFADRWNWFEDDGWWDIIGCALVALVWPISEPAWQVISWRRRVIESRREQRRDTHGPALPRAIVRRR